MFKRPALGLALFAASCSSTPSLMVQTVPGDYLALAKCVHRQMFNKMDQIAWSPSLADFEDQHVAEIRAIGTAVLVASPMFRQRFEQEGNMVKMIYWVPPSLNMNGDRRAIQALWDACTGPAGQSPNAL